MAICHKHTKARRVKALDSFLSSCLRGRPWPWSQTLAGLLDFSSTLVAKLRTRLHLRTAFCAGHRLCRGYHFRAARIGERRMCQVCGCACWTGGLRTTTRLALRLIHCVRHSAGHRIANREACSQSGARSSATTASILCCIAHRVCSLELCITSNIPNYSHRGSFVHGSLDLGRQGNVFNHKLGKIQSVSLEIISQFATSKPSKFIVVGSQIQRSNFRLSQRVTKAAD